MSAQALLAALSARGIELRVEDGKLKYTAPPGALDDALRAEIAAARGAIIAHLTASIATDGSLTTLPEGAEAPLSFAQERMVFLSALDPSGVAYLVRMAVEIRGALDVRALAGAFAALEARHPILRTFAKRLPSGEVVQVAAPAREAALVVEAMSDDRSALEARPFDLFEPPLWRPRLLLAGPDRAVLVITTHLFLADGWSLEILIDELGVLYQAAVRGARAALAEPGLHYADFAADQRRRGENAAWASEIDFWKRELSPPCPPLRLTVDRPRGARRFGRSGRIAVRIEGAEAAAIRRSAAASDVTPFSVFLATYRLILGRWSGRNDVAVATIVSNRTRSELEKMPGSFANTVLLRLRWSDDASLETIYRQSQDRALKAFAHQSVPFERLVEELPSSPEIRALFVFHARPTFAPDAWKGLEIRRHALPGGVTNLDIDVAVTEVGTAYEIDFGYDADAIDAARAERFLDCWRTLLRRGSERPRETAAALTTDLGAPAVESNFVSTPVHAAPAPASAMNDLEALIAGVFAETTGFAKPSPRDAFFDIGGHSVTALRAIAKIETLTGIALDPGDLMMQTIGQLAAALEQRRKKPSPEGGLFTRLAKRLRLP